MCYRKKLYTFNNESSSYKIFQLNPKIIAIKIKILYTNYP